MTTYLNIPIEKLCVSPETSFRKVVETIQQAEKQIVVVVDKLRHLLGLITDGDVRRAVLENIPMDTPASEVMQRSFIACAYGTSLFDIYELMQVKSVRHIPLVGDDGTLEDLAWISDLILQPKLSVPAVVMAGGFGHRLRPLTQHMPKPMLPVGDRPLLELMIQQLKDAGIHRVHVSTHFQGDKIVNHFGDGCDFGVDISYLNEDQPLGTAGILSKLNGSQEPIFVINGDILTRIDFRSMLSFHLDHNADLTVAVRQYDMEVPYGVLECTGPQVENISEKPTYRFFVNAGIYILQPTSYHFIPENQRFDMTDLIEALISARRTVVSFPITEYWLDIGKPNDYQKAQEDIKNGKY